MYGFLLLVLVIFISGFIAYLGDQIGMKVGKKRLSLFGLRPKYTSIIITILTGVLIAILTMTVLLATNNGVRQAIFNIREVVNRLDSLNQQLLLKDQDLQKMQEEIDEKGEELSSIQSQKEQLESRLRRTQQEYEQAMTSLKSAQNDIKQMEIESENLEEKIADLNQQRQILETRIGELNDQVAAVTEDYQEARELASQFRAGIYYYMGEDIVYQRGDIIYSDVIQAGQSQEDTVQALRDFLDRANEEVKKRPVKTNEELGTALILQNEDIFNVASAILNKKSERMIVGLVAIVNVPKNDWVYAKFIIDEDFKVFEKDEEIASSIIDAGSEPTYLEKELEKLLKDVNEKAIKEGLLTDSQGQVGTIDFSQFYQLLKEIQNYQGEVVVRVYAREDIWRENRLSSNLEFTIESVDGGEQG